MNNLRKGLWFFGVLFFALLSLTSATFVAAGGEPALFLGGTLTPTPTATPTALSSALTSYGGSMLEAFIQVPPDVVPQPYIILDAVEVGADVSSIVIKGSFSDKNFTCDNVPCIVPFPQSDNILFKAYSDSGLTSESVRAVVTVDEVDTGFVVRISSVNKYTNFTDSCRTTWGLPPDIPPFWAEFPQFYFELNTQRTLHYLATKLIVAGIVDVSACPNGGVSADLTWPTGCGLAQAKEEMIEWQNQYDSYIWTASKEIGIPPKILKTLIQTESQFWPANQRFYVDEYGLGQVTQLGLDILLRDDPVLFQSFCPKVLEYCNTFYTNLSPENQALVRGALLDSLNASCPECDNGFDFTRAGRSVFYVARLLQANCNNVDAIMSDFGTFEETEYEDYWKFTLFTYHSGIACFHSAVDATLKAKQEVTWENLSENTECIDGKTYVDGLWGSLLSFDIYRYYTYEINADFGDALFDAPPTPTPAPTLVPSAAEIRVQVLLEYPDHSTAPLDDIPVLVSLGDGTTLLQNTSRDGFATFDMQGYPVNLKTVVSLPGLYYVERFELPLSGVKEITFIFASPVLPPSLP